MTKPSLVEFELGVFMLYYCCVVCLLDRHMLPLFYMFSNKALILDIIFILVLEMLYI